MDGAKRIGPSMIEELVGVEPIQILIGLQFVRVNAGACMIGDRRSSASRRSFRRLGTTLDFIVESN